MDYCYQIYESDVGPLTLVSNGTALVTVHYGEGHPNGCLQEEDEILMQAIMEFNQFFAGQRKAFTVPVDPMGSREERKIYLYLYKHVGYGKFTTYERVAETLQMPLEAVEKAIDSNSCPIIIPCHRVIGADKTLRGYVGPLKLKKGLLKFEHDHLNKDFVAPDYHEDDEDSAPPVD